MEYSSIVILRQPTDLSGLLQKLRSKHVIVPYVSGLGNLLPSSVQPFDLEWDVTSGEPTVVLLASTEYRDAYDHLKTYVAQALRGGLGSERLLMPGLLVLFAGHEQGTYLRLPENASPEAMHNAIVMAATSLGSAKDLGPRSVLAALTEACSSGTFAPTGISPVVFPETLHTTESELRLGVMLQSLERERQKRGLLYAVVAGGIGILLAILSLL